MRRLHPVVFAIALASTSVAQAADTYYPGSGPEALATWLFEDNWPNRGDYDLNDLVVGYQMHLVHETDRVDHATFVFVVKARGASFRSGFGFSLPSTAGAIASAKVKSILSGCAEEDVAWEADSLSARATFILFDDAFVVLPPFPGCQFVNTEPEEDCETVARGKEFRLEVAFAAGQGPTVAEVLTQVNPFIFRNVFGVRRTEVHLPNFPPTNQMDHQKFGTGDDRTTLGAVGEELQGTGHWFMTSDNLPWALDIPTVFSWPLETRSISSAYQDFADWAESAGTRHEAWFVSEGPDAGQTDADLIWQRGIAVDWCADAFDPCLNIVCDQPPAPRCVNVNRMARYSADGDCDNGVCVYAATEEPCTDCCQGAEVNPTGDPIGGGLGYSRAPGIEDADYVVATRQELENALALAQAGDLIIIPGEVEIDLTGTTTGGPPKIHIPGGVTLAGMRGMNGSAGALLYSTLIGEYLFVADGPDVRLSGLRIRGPDPDMAVESYVPPISQGIYSAMDRLEVDNCELSGWAYAAIHLAYSTGHRIHHNFIHDNQRVGLGYGTVFDRAEGVVEANLYHRCRHDVAATGRPGTSYEARYNVVLEQAIGHNFDMHGESDFDKNTVWTLFSWRFDEGTGDVAHDTGTEGPTDCLLTNMDPVSCWVVRDPRFWTALHFDGVDDSLECEADSVLASETGTIEFFVAPDGSAGERELVRIDDAEGAYLAVGLADGNRIRVSAADSSGPRLDLLSDEGLPDLASHFIAITQAGARVRVYVDGTEWVTAGTNSSYWTGGMDSPAIRAGGSDGHHFAGVLDELRLFQVSRTALQVQAHAQGFADIAGDRLSIHHNTFGAVGQAAVVVRGIPYEYADIHHNRGNVDVGQRPFFDMVVRYLPPFLRMTTRDDWPGTTPPEGILPPMAQAQAVPDRGRVPLTVMLDASTSETPWGPTRGYQWDFGDGTGAWSDVPQIQHDYWEPGRVLATMTVSDFRGAMDRVRVPVTVQPAVSGRQIVSFWVKDSYRGPATGYYRKQVLVGDAVVWQDDAAGDEGWQHVVVDATAAFDAAQVNGLAPVRLRVANLSAIPATAGEEPRGLDVYWDDVTVFGADATVNDFEEGSWGDWTYSETDSGWLGSVASWESHTGVYSARVVDVVGPTNPAGNFAQLTAWFSSASPDVIGYWDLDQESGQRVQDRSSYYNDCVRTGDPGAAWVPGIMDNALEFNGAGQGVDCGEDVLSPADQGAIEFWVRAGPQVGEVGWVTWTGSAGTERLDIRLTAAREIGVRLQTEGGGGWEVRSMAALPDDGMFHHVAVSQPGSGLQIFLDGVPSEVQGTNGNAWAGALASPARLVFGSAEAPFVGVLDDLRLWRRPLTEAEVRQHHALALPLGTWAFDEGSESIAHDGSDHHLDCSFRNMTPVGSWITGPDGGFALRFDGVDDFLECSAAPLLATQEGTIEFRFRTDQFGANMDLFYLYESAFTDYLLIRRTSANKVLLLIKDAGNTLVQTTTSATVTDSEWHHLAVTQDGRGPRIYLDGTEALATTTGSGTWAWSGHLTVNGFWMGKGSWSWFAGDVDDVRVHGRSLSAREVLRRAWCLGCD